MKFTETVLRILFEGKRNHLTYLHTLGWKRDSVVVLGKDSVHYEFSHSEIPSSRIYINYESDNLTPTRLWIGSRSGYLKVGLENFGEFAKLVNDIHITHPSSTSNLLED